MLIGTLFLLLDPILEAASGPVSCPPYNSVPNHGRTGADVYSGGGLNSGSYRCRELRNLTTDGPLHGGWTPGHHSDMQTGDVLTVPLLVNQAELQAEIRGCRQIFNRSPRLSLRTPVRRVDQADCNIQLVLQFNTEVISGR